MQREKIPAPPGAQRSRGGRPSAQQAGEVDRRILEAATALVLEQGFAATTCEQVAVRAGAGKASVYARYANKDDLFEAVVRDYVERSMAPSEPSAVKPAVLDRLRAAGEGLLFHSLQPGVIAMMRAVISAVYRMPHLALFAHRIGRDHCVMQIALAIAGEESGNAEAVARATPAASKFIDLAIAPHQVRALMGDVSADLLEEARLGLDESLDLLSKGGWLDGWE